MFRMRVLLPSLLIEVNSYEPERRFRKHHSRQLYFP
uniref:Uncharacterized protein n=2 Tax=unclassified Kuttervirus TaxID=2770329 RepID=A0AAU8GJ82_9CAUD